MKLSRFAIYTIFIASILFPADAMTGGYASSDPEKLENKKPDYHQYEGKILRIIDADTVEVEMYLLPGLVYTVHVRSRGVDAPELDGSCDWEKKIAVEAKEAIEKRFPIGSWVYVENIKEGSFAGRVIADIKQWYGNQRWRTVSRALLEKSGRWAVPYDKKEKFDWCKTVSD